MAEDRADASTRDGGWFARGNQAAWIGAVGVLLAALIGVAVPLLLASGDDDGGGAAAPTTPTTTPSAEAPGPGSTPPAASPSPSPPASASAPTPAPTSAGSERWHGTLAFDSQSKELDEGQPVTRDYQAGDLEISGWRDHYSIKGLGSTVLSLWPADATALPGYQDCANTVDAEGVDDHRLTKGMVVCVRTSEGNVARLRLVSLPGEGSRATFDAVIWAAE
ncbi:hypothetical protein ABZ725_16310 [Streptomyces sp. NPDC006872]|uniref:hypothetical protein n=1 Tax=Streptomyces sp. NPDC006872 TaxID=3155720 RepID=UPI0034009366